MSIDWVIEANKLSAELLRPDINIYIDISPEESMNRINKGRAEIEMYETLDNLKKVKELYMLCFEKLKHEEKIEIINGERNEASIAEDVWQQVSKIM